MTPRTLTVVAYGLLLPFCALAQMPDDTTTTTEWCTVCADQSPPAEGASFGMTTCEFINESLIGTPMDTPTCLEVQLNAFLACGCPTYPEEFCGLCGSPTADGDDEDGGGASAVESMLSLPWMNDAVIPGTNVTCADAAFVEGDAEMCATFQAAGQWFCGCPAVERKTECSVCGSNDRYDPNATMVDVTRLLPPNFVVSCGALDREAGVECSALEGSFFVDLAAYCGCSNVEETTRNSTDTMNMNSTDAMDTNSTDAMDCTLCGAAIPAMNPDVVVLNNDVTCRQLEDSVLPFVSDADYCTSLQEEHGPTCCEPASPSAVTTEAPATEAPPGTPTDATDGESSNATTATMAPTSASDSNGTASTNEPRATPTDTDPESRASVISGRACATLAILGLLIVS